VNRLILRSLSRKMVRYLCWPEGCWYRCCLQQCLYLILKFWVYGHQFLIVDCSSSLDVASSSLVSVIPHCYCNSSFADLSSSLMSDLFNSCLEVLLCWLKLYLKVWYLVNSCSPAVFFFFMNSSARGVFSSIQPSLFSIQSRLRILRIYHINSLIPSFVLSGALRGEQPFFVLRLYWALHWADRKIFARHCYEVNAWLTGWLHQVRSVEPWK